MISIVTCVYNPKGLVEKCVEAVSKHTTDYEHILVYNHPPYDDVLPYLNSLDKVKVVDPEKNLGCAEGYNYGFQFAKGDHLVKLDDDVEVTSGWIEESLKVMQEEMVAFVCLEMRSHNGEVAIPPAESAIIDLHGMKVSPMLQTIPLSSLSCMVFSSSFWKSIGGFKGNPYYAGIEQDALIKAQALNRRGFFIRSAHCVHWNKSPQTNPLYQEWKALYITDKTQESFDDWLETLPQGKCINLACGDFYYPGWINVDLDKKVEADIYTDVGELPFEDESADFIYAGHIIEHFFPRDVPRFVKEWLRVLKKGGKLAIVVPDTKMLAQRYVNGEISCKEFSYEHLYCPERDLRLHKACYDEDFLKETLRESGLEILKRIDVETCSYLTSHTPWQVGFEYKKR